MLDSWGVDWIELAKDTIQWWVFVRAEINHERLQNKRFIQLWNIFKDYFDQSTSTCLHASPHTQMHTHTHTPTT